ncbi:MAG: hypothetical protein HC913_17175, partial [Microscillaceae bacterium]|nr:hypothetical protein [Microscillaceae bacterium]
YYLIVNIRFSEFSYSLLLWSYYQQGILKEKINEFKEVKKLDLSEYEFRIKEQEEIQKLLPHCEINFSNIYYVKLLWSYYQQGILKEKIAEFKKSKKWICQPILLK